ncbi:MAG: hypothetical protein Q8914_08595, partial [Bacteroidota bacterium]|nr:hypothetical protein [Bacteroidota bacterium]
PRFCFGIDTYLTNGNVYCDVAPSLGLAIRINKLMAVSILSTYNFGPQDMSFDPSTEETKNPVITVFAGLQVSF